MREREWGCIERAGQSVCHCAENTVVGGGRHSIGAAPQTYPGGCGIQPTCCLPYRPQADFRKFLLFVVVVPTFSIHNMRHPPTSSRQVYPVMVQRAPVDDRSSSHRRGDSHGSGETSGGLDVVTVGEAAEMLPIMSHRRPDHSVDEGLVSVVHAARLGGSCGEATDVTRGRPVTRWTLFGWTGAGQSAQLFRHQRLLLT